MKELLPLGSVVVLKRTEERVLVIGRLIKEKETGIIHEYAACLYPQGSLDSNQIMVFNTEDIQMLLAVGYQDAEEIEYRKNLKELLDGEVELK